MRALVKAKAEPGIWMQDVPVPEIGPNDVLIKVRKTSICGTDIHIWNWDAWSQKTIKVPMVIGHEFMGEIARLGAEVTGFKVGERVTGEGHITCGHCRNCRAGKRHLCRNTVGLGVNRPGCFAEYVSLPAFNVFRVPTEIPDDIASFFDPAGQRGAHRALLRPGRRGRAHHRGRPHRGHGRGDLQARRRPARGGHRRERLPARARPEDGRHPGGERAHRRRWAT